jgi:hypothetical protein
MFELIFVGVVCFLVGFLLGAKSGVYVGYNNRMNDSAIVVLMEEDETGVRAYDLVGKSFIYQAKNITELVEAVRKMYEGKLIVFSKEV